MTPKEEECVSVSSFEPPFCSSNVFLKKRRGGGETPIRKCKRRTGEREKKMEKSRWLVAPFWLEREREEERGADFTNVVSPPLYHYYHSMCMHA